MPTQEKGVRKSSALPYELYANGGLTPDKKKFQLTLTASRESFGAKAAGSPFNVYAPGKFKMQNAAFEELCNWSYAVAPGDELTDHWVLDQFEGSNYHLCVYGPNGFYREFKGDQTDPLLNVRCEYQKGKKKKTLSGMEVKIRNLSQKAIDVELIDLSYGQPSRKQRLEPNAEKTIAMDLIQSHGWYDFALKVQDNKTFGRRFSGRVETGEIGFTDPSMG